MITANPSDSNSGLSLLEELLADQQRLTAVEKFSQRHGQHESLLQEPNYRDLIPLTAPGDGEQYAFEVDLQSCTGCKACVTACHQLNGLEEGETWRSVGLLHGGSAELPVIQHVTTACHHCLEPACLEGCPVEAYEKDARTGIVHHLDDQCIGCKYCIFKCPYDVPQYSREKGIVRKCDMCHSRLATGEAPACVQSCPNRAIRIATIDRRSVLEESETNTFLPGSPEPSYTLPTTQYKTDRAPPRNLLPADYFSARVQQAHWSLVIMLVLTQMSVGAFVAEQFLAAQSAWSATSMSATRLVHLLCALGLVLLGSGSALAHLGRPRYAYRALIGLRRSWLSREILAFGLFPVAVSFYALAACATTVTPWWTEWIGYLAGTIGAAAVYCSAMVYVDTQRAFWNSGLTFPKFFGTTAVLGIPAALLISILGTAFSDSSGIGDFMNHHGLSLCKAILVASVFKLCFESSIFLHLQKRSLTPQKRTAQLLIGELGLTSLKRYFFGFFGGIVLPMILLAGGSFHPFFVTVLVVVSFVALLIGELIERYLFFSAVVAPKMPGVQAS